MQRVREVRSLGLDVGVDFHGRVHKGMAKQLARLLEPLQPMFIEGKHSSHLESITLLEFSVEPLLPTQPEEIADLAQLVSTPIALGERLYTRTDFRPYLERRAIDIAQPDVRYPDAVQIQLLIPPFFIRSHTVAGSANCTDWRPTLRRTMLRWPHTVL